MLIVIVSENKGLQEQLKGLTNKCNKQSREISALQSMLETPKKKTKVTSTGMVTYDFKSNGSTIANTQFQVIDSPQAELKIEVEESSCLRSEKKNSADKTTVALQREVEALRQRHYEKIAEVTQLRDLLAQTERQLNETREQCSILEEDQRLISAMQIYEAIQKTLSGEYNDALHALQMQLKNPEERACKDAIIALTREVTRLQEDHRPCAQTLLNTQIRINERKLASTMCQTLAQLFF